MTINEALKGVEKIEQLANGSKLAKIAAHPIRYLKSKVLLNEGNKQKISTTFFGYPIKVSLPAGMDIYLTGGKTHTSEIKLTKFILLNLKPGSVFIDVGAHFGFYSLLASFLVGKEGAVVGIEGSITIYNIYSENINKFKNISGFNFACSNTDGDLTFYEFPMLFSEYNTLAIEQFSDAPWIEKNKPVKTIIQGTRLDALLGKLKFKPDFIKIDVEGAELSVVQGMSSILNSDSHLIIAMEYLNTERSNDSHREAANILIEAGFAPFIIQGDGNTNKVTIKDIDVHLIKNKLESDNIIFKR